MPTMHASDEDGGAFTVINHEGEEARERVAAGDVPLPPNVNVVKPLRRADDQREHFNSASTRAPPPDPAPAPPLGPPPRTILDPKFSRALDFKLRRLKEKEILQANLRRPTRYKPRNGLAASSIPNINCKEREPIESMSRSHPRIDIIAPPEDATPKMDNTPSPGRRARAQLATRSSLDNDKPRFVTTVKSGQFLLPPPEVATLLGLETLYPPQEREKIVYSYASKPKALASRSKRSPPETKKEMIPNGMVSTGTRAGAGTTRRGHAGDVSGALSGVRALVAGVVGLRHLQHSHSQDNHRCSGSLTTPAPYSNVMHERRVVRGATFASHPPHAAAGDGGESAAARAARTRRRAAARRAAARLRPGTPPPAPGRRHHPIQTEYYLEELFDKGVEMEVGVQTDLFVDRPATPVYVPAKTGADAATQIYPGDLFDFELEVQPILEVLVGKSTEQALAEVAQEEELATLREQQRRYCELRDAERAERQRLAAQHMRLHTEKERRVSECRAASAAAQEARARAAAATLVQGYVAELLPATLAGLTEQGYLVQRIETGVDEEFMPWLVQEVSREMESIITSRDVITEIVRDVVECRAQLYRDVGDREHSALDSPPLHSITPPSDRELEGQALEE